MGISFIPKALVRVPINEYYISGRLDSHPIVSFSLWDCAPAPNRNKRTFDWCNSVLDDLGKLVDLVMAC